MSFATRCPACGTVFEAAPEQLALADGWVRCGRCSEIFDGAESRCDVEAPVSRPEGEPSAPHAATQADAFGDALSSFRLDMTLPAAPAQAAGAERAASMPGGAQESTDDAEDVENVEDAKATEAQTEAQTRQRQTPGEVVGGPAQAAVRNGDPWRELPSLDLDTAAASPPAPTTATATAATVPASPATVLPLSGEPVAAGADAAARNSTASRADPPTGVVQAASESSSDFAADSPFHTGGKGAPERSGSHRARLVRRALIALALVLLLILVAQVVYRQRDAVAAHHPSLGPTLAALCGVAGCRVGALRRPEDVVVDGVSFTHVQDSQRYRFDVTLRNRAGVTLAMPAIELSLLDTQDRPVIRRVLAPADFGAPETLAAHAEHSAAMSLAVADAVPRIVGYAVVAFYP